MRLSQDQIRRASEQFKITHPGQEDRLSAWIAGFESESDPETEIRLWEWVARALERYRDTDGYEPECHAAAMSFMIGRAGFRSDEEYLRINPPADVSMAEARKMLSLMAACADDRVPAGGVPVRVQIGPSTALLDRVVEYFESRKIKGTRNDADSTFSFTAILPSGRFRCAAVTREQTCELMFTTRGEVEVPQDKTGDILALCAHVNARHAHCTLVYHFDTQFVTCRTGLAAPLVLVGSDLLNPVVNGNFRSPNHCYPHVVGVAEGRMSEAEACEAILGR